MAQSPIHHPIISEKATRLAALRTYVFLVRNGATAPEVRKAIQARYKVSVTDVRMINVKPKRRRLGASVGVRPGYRKAMVTLAEGQKLDVLPHS